MNELLRLASKVIGNETGRRYATHAFIASLCLGIAAISSKPQIPQATASTITPSPQAESMPKAEQTPKGDILSGLKQGVLSLYGVDEKKGPNYVDEDGREAVLSNLVVPLTIRESPDISGKEFSEDEMRRIGIDPKSTRSIKVKGMLVWGGDYNSIIEEAHRDDGYYNRQGQWLMIVGEDGKVGFISRNFIEELKKIEPKENQKTQAPNIGFFPIRQLAHQRVKRPSQPLLPNQGRLNGRRAA